MPIVHTPPETAVADSKHKPTLLVNDLIYRYPDGHEALTGVSFQIGAGEKVALVGPNGAGKSTLMLNLNGIFQGEGALEVAGLPVIKENLPVIRGRVGLVFQNPDDQLFSPTVFEDVAFGPLHMGLPEAEVRARVTKALAQVGMSGFEDRLSYHMSTGQKKRVAIATVLSMEPEILILDEPSAGLDPRSRRSLINLLQDLSLTMLVSTHDLYMVRELFPRMIIMDGGQIVADGATAVLLNDESLLTAHGLEKP